MTVFAVHAVGSLPPARSEASLGGGGLGRGVHRRKLSMWLPPPPTPPRKGEGRSFLVSKLSFLRMGVLR